MLKAIIPTKARTPIIMYVLIFFTRFCFNVLQHPDNNNSYYPSKQVFILLSRNIIFITANNIIYIIFNVKKSKTVINNTKRKM